MLPWKAGWIPTRWLGAPGLLKSGSQDLGSPHGARPALLPQDCLLEIAVPSGGLAALETSLLLSQIQHWLNKGPDAMGEAAGPSLIFIPDDKSFTSHRSVSLGSLSTEKGLGLSTPYCGLGGRGLWSSPPLYLSISSVPPVWQALEYSFV